MLAVNSKSSLGCNGHNIVLNLISRLKLTAYIKLRNIYFNSSPKAHAQGSRATLTATAGIIKEMINT